MVSGDVRRVDFRVWARIDVGFEWRDCDTCDVGPAGGLDDCIRLALNTLLAP